MASSLRIGGSSLTESKNQKVFMTLHVCVDSPCLCEHMNFSKYLQIIFVEKNPSVNLLFVLVVQF